MWPVWLVFCECGFHSVCPLMDKDKRLMEASWWERLTVGKMVLFMMSGAMISKSLIQFSVNLQGCVPSLLFDLRPNYGGGNEDNYFKRFHAGTAALSASNPQQATDDPHLCQRLLDTHRQVWVSLLWGHCSFLLGPGAHKVLFLPSKSMFPNPV